MDVTYARNPFPGIASPVVGARPRQLQGSAWQWKMRAPCRRQGPHRGQRLSQSGIWPPHCTLILGYEPCALAKQDTPVTTEDSPPELLEGETLACGNSGFQVYKTLLFKDAGIHVVMPGPTPVPASC